MSKRRYHAVALDQVDVAQIVEKVSGENVLVSVDVAKEDFFAGISGVDGGIVGTVKWKHPVQTIDFLALLEALGGSSSVDVALEPTGVYGDSLRWQLDLRGYSVYRVSAKAVHDYREVFDGVSSSHDAKSCALIAALHCGGRSQEWKIPTDVEREFKAEVYLLNVYEREYRRNYNRLSALVCRHWPELTTIIDLDTVTAQEVLRVYGGAAAVSSRPDEVRALMQETGGRFLSDAKVEALVGQASSTLGMPQIGCEVDATKAIAAEVMRYKKLKAGVERQLRALTKSTEEVANMGAAVGKTTAAVLIATAGRPSRYSSAAAYEKALGLNLREKSSGKLKGALHITKRGSGLARRYLYMAALRQVYRNPVVRTYYEQAVARRGGKQKRLVLVAIMRKLARALYHVAQGAPYDAGLLFNVVAQRLGT